MIVDIARAGGMTAHRSIPVTPSCGNVFEDIGVPDADLTLAKADLALAIASVIADRGWTQEDAAAALGIDQPKVSLLLRGKLSGVSFERLMRFLNRLNYDIDVTIRQSPDDDAHTSVRFPNDAPAANG
jgi:predicted XRE-type DNA-binding protein